MPSPSDFDWFDPSLRIRAHVPEPVTASEDKRSDYERDRARIVHSVAFRKLQGKTQVFATGSNADFLRSRVTHSIEVAQIGRALALRFNVPEALVEAACLGHDLGHPPFGHTGEMALHELMKPYGGFEGNAQTFRIATYLELKHPDYEGLDLCRLTLLSLIKYPYRAGAAVGKFIYDVDYEREQEWLLLEHDLLDTKVDDPPRTLPCQLMDWADDIAYSVHDLEDGIAGGILQPRAWTQDEVVRDIHQNVIRAPVKWASTPPDEETVRDILKRLSGELAGFAPDIPKDIVREFTRGWIDRFATAGHVTGGGGTVYDFTLELPEEVRVENQVLKALTFEYLIRDHRTAAAAFRGRRIVQRLFKALLDNTSAPLEQRYLLFPRDRRETLASYEGDEADTARFVCDYVASLTEGQAIDLYRRLFEPHGPDGLSL